MNPWLDTVLVLLILTNLHMLGSSRISACIRAVAIQAMLLGMISLLAQSGNVGLVGGNQIRRAVTMPIFQRDLEQFAGEIQGTAERFVGRRK